MTFNTYFRASSYAVVACGALTLAVSGGMGLELTVAFAALLCLAWKLEDTRWQLTERIGLVVVLLSLPLFYLDWKYQMSVGEARERVGVSALAHLILFLSAVKLLQVKADRDWVFLYLISFFEVLLAAGLSISPTYLALLCLYTLCTLCAIVAFEMRKAGRYIEPAETRLLVPPDSTLVRRMMKRRAQKPYGISRRLPVVALGLLVLIFMLAMPLFFIVPRYGNGALARTGGGLTGFVGFSESVRLGSIGRLQLSNEVVMRVRVEDGQSGRPNNLRWRGVALDNFDGRNWRKSRIAPTRLAPANERGLFQLGTTERLDRLTTQTFFIEPIDTPVLFAASRVVAVQGAFPFLQRDAEGSLSSIRHEQGRLSYRVYSETNEPDEELLRLDAEPYSAAFERYLQRPDALDPRIEKLARDVILSAGARNRYDKARAIESHLQTDYGYTLDQKASGEDPLSDFLFRVREGHCEYFATAMAVMLRTQGIATRVVNGFQTGVYNDAADAYTVTQREAHSWVEVYFPETDDWVTFDPTPAAGRTARESAGLNAQLGKYAEALELLWIQYVVSYDRQEQRSLVTSIRNTLSDYRRSIGEEISGAKTAITEWVRSIFTGGAQASTQRWQAIALLLSILLLLVPSALIVRRTYRLGFWRGLKFWQAEEKRASAVEFYERLMRALASRGMRRAENETPLEFATTVGMPEALKITQAYNRVRYGEQPLSPNEITEIEMWLSRMEKEK
jgi:transglutaminase-like putative cysteine protease